MSVIASGLWFWHVPSQQAVQIRDPDRRLDDGKVQVLETTGAFRWSHPSDLKALHQDDPRHPEHGKAPVTRPATTERIDGKSAAVREAKAVLAGDSNDDGWRRHCPSEEEVPEVVTAIVSRTASFGGRRHISLMTGRGIRDDWGNRVYAWQPAPDPAQEPYSPPRGWVDYRDREPCSQDADPAGEVMVDKGDGCLSPCRWDEVGEVRAIGVDQNAVRWATTKWLREATA